MNRDFDKKPIWLKWVAWVALVFPLTLYVAISTYDTWPALIHLAVLSGLAVIGLSWYVATHLTHDDSVLRQRAFAAAILIEFALVANAGVHGGASRSHENAKAAMEERHREEDRDAARKRQQAADSVAATQAAIALARAETRRADADVRRYHATGVAPSAPASRSQHTVAPPSAAPAAEAAAPVPALSPAATRESWFWWVFGALLLELVAAITGALLVIHERLADRDGNGVADWIDRRTVGFREPIGRPAGRGPGLRREQTEEASHR